jgi:hypothetical protein
MNLGNKYLRKKRRYFFVKVLIRLVGVMELRYG